MCIHVKRWYMCPMATEGHQPGLGLHNPNPNTWEVGQPVSYHDLEAFNPKRYPGFRYLRHRQDTWIRCAGTKGRLCEQTPLQVRTELSKTPCPWCTKDDACIFSDVPYRIERQEFDVWPVDEDLVPRPTRIRTIAQNYFDDMLGIVNAFIDVECFGQPLRPDSFMTHFLNMSCTQHVAHVVNDAPGQAIAPTCDPDCYTEMSHRNLSRAVRAVDGKALRAGSAPNWFGLARDQRHEMLAWRDTWFGRLPNQRWLELPENEFRVRLERLNAMLGHNIHQLIHLGPSVQPWQEHEQANIPSAAEWRDILRQRESIATIFTTYAALDPGLPESFLDLLMRNHILPILNPYFEPRNAPDRWELLDCTSPAGDSTKRMLERCTNFLADAYRENLFQDRLKGLKGFTDLFIKGLHTEWHNCLIGDRELCAECYHHTIQNADDPDVDPICPICTFPFWNNAPPHWLAMKIPCCGQVLHVRCLKGSVHMKESNCPFCRGGLNPEDAHGDTEYATLEAKAREELDGNALITARAPPGNEAWQARWQGRDASDDDSSDEDEGGEPVGEDQGGQPVGDHHEGEPVGQHQEDELIHDVIPQAENFAGEPVGQHQEDELIHDVIFQDENFDGVPVHEIVLSERSNSDAGDGAHDEMDLDPEDNVDEAVQGNQADAEILSDNEPNEEEPDQLPGPVDENVVAAHGSSESGYDTESDGDDEMDVDDNEEDDEDDEEDDNQGGDSQGDDDGEDDDDDGIVWLDYNEDSPGEESLDDSGSEWEP